MKEFLNKIFKRLFFKKEEPPPFFTRDLIKGKSFDIGEYTYGSPSILHWGENSTLKIGRFCSIADGVTIFLGGNHRTDWVTTYPFNVIHRNLFSPDFSNAADIVGHPATKGNVNIGNDVWIGKGATIMSGVTIGDGAVIAAFSVVAKNVKPFEIVGGNPARHIRFRFSNEVIESLLTIKWWDWDNKVINEKVKNLCSEDINEFVKESLVNSLK